MSGLRDEFIFSGFGWVHWEIKGGKGTHHGMGSGAAGKGGDGWDWGRRGTLLESRGRGFSDEPFNRLLLECSVCLGATGRMLLQLVHGFESLFFVPGQERWGGKETFSCLMCSYLKLTSWPVWRSTGHLQECFELAELAVSSRSCDGVTEIRSSLAGGISPPEMRAHMDGLKLMP